MPYVGIITKDSPTNKHVVVDMGGQNMKIAYKDNIPKNNHLLLHYHFNGTGRDKELKFVLESAKDLPKDVVKKDGQYRIFREAKSYHEPYTRTAGKCKRKHVKYFRKEIKQYTCLPFVRINDATKEVHGTVVLCNNFKEVIQSSPKEFVCFDCPVNPLRFEKET